MVRRRRHPRRPSAVIALAALILLASGVAVWTHQGHTDAAPRRLAAAPRRALSLPSAPPMPTPSLVPALPTSYQLSVPPLSQLPQLENGCEVTSLAMLLTAVGHPVSKMTLAAEEPTDPTPAVLKPIAGFSGNPILEVVRWGNPNVGFVGSVVGGSQLGYGIYHGPLLRLLSQILPGRAEDLTGDPFSTLLRHVAEGVPVEAWTTITFQPTDDWVTWQSPEGPVRATPLEHAVLIVGYTPTSILVNNPYTGQAGEAVNRTAFVEAWRQLGRQAITVTIPRPVAPTELLP